MNRVLELAARVALMTDTCGDPACTTPEFRPDTMLTQINPPGGYGLPQFLVCDTCMRSGRWDHWIAEHWPNWPEPRKP